MRDGIPSGNGESRIMRVNSANLPSTYAEYRNLLANGMMYDSSINNAGWTQVGDKVNKGLLLADDTALAMELDPVTATPNDAFKYLLRHRGTVVALYTTAIMQAAYDSGYTAANKTNMYKYCLERLQGMNKVGEAYANMLMIDDANLRACKTHEEIVSNTPALQRIQSNSTINTIFNTFVISWTTFMNDAQKVRDMINTPALFNYVFGNSTATTAFRNSAVAFNTVYNSPDLFRTISFNENSLKTLINNITRARDIENNSTLLSILVNSPLSNTYYDANITFTGPHDVDAGSNMGYWYRISRTTLSGLYLIKYMRTNKRQF